MNFLRNKKINKIAGAILILIFAFSFFGSFANDTFAQATPSEERDSAWYDVGGQLSEVTTNIIKKMSQALLGIAGWILWFSATALNFVIDFSILKMASFIDKTDGIKEAWVIVRDLINMLFIFGLLFISINLIIKGSGSNTKKLLTNIIAAALLINFSFFFTTVLIDVSNQTTTVIYDSISNNCNLKSSKEAGTDYTVFGKVTDNGLSDCFMNHLKLQTIYSPKESYSPDIADFPGDITKILTISFLGSIFIILAAVSFLAMALMLLFRFVSLIFILVASPVMFIGMIIPAWNNIQQSWSEALKKNLLFPPVMFLFIKISLLIMAGGVLTQDSQIKVNGQIKDANFRSLIESGNSDVFTGILFQYLLAIGFLIGSMIIAQKVGAVGAKWSTQSAGRMIMGGMAKAGRNTFGAAARRLADSESIKSTAQFGNNAATRFAARTALKYSDKTAKSSFDARTGIASALKAANAPTIDLGKAQSGGFDKDVETKTKEYEAENKLMKGAKIPEERAQQIQEDLLKEAQKNPKSELGKSYTAMKENIAEETVSTKESINKAQSSLNEAQMDVDTTPDNATPEQVKAAKDKLELAKQKFELAKEKLEKINKKERDWVKNNANLYASKTLSPNSFFTKLFQGQTRIAAKKKAADNIRKDAVKSKDKKKKEQEDKKLDDILKNTKKDAE